MTVNNQTSLLLGPQEPHGRVVSRTDYSALLAEYKAVVAERDRLATELAQRDNECGRFWYHAHTQEVRVCRLPKGHAPEPAAVDGCGCPGEIEEETTAMSATLKANA